jgi:hypothetical protein
MPCILVLQPQPHLTLHSPENVLAKKQVTGYSSWRSGAAEQLSSSAIEQPHVGEESPGDNLEGERAEKRRAEKRRAECYPSSLIQPHFLPWNLLTFGELREPSQPSFPLSLDPWRRSLITTSEAYAKSHPALQEIHVACCSSTLLSFSP